MGVVTGNIEKTAEKVEKKGNGCFSVISTIVVVCSLIFGGIKSCTNNMFGNHGGYITTLQELNEYSKIESAPMNKEVGKIANDTVLKVQKVTNKGELTWIMVYKLTNDDSAVKTFVLLPEKTKIKNTNKYVLYNDNSKTWNNYYAQIDQKNKPLYEKYKNEFNEAIKDIKVLKGSDNIVKESVKEKSWFLEPTGYFDFYISNGNDFYYIDKKDKNKFLEIYKRFKNKYENERIPYF